MATTPDPATTEWVPLWDLEGGTSAGGGGGPHHTTHEVGGTDQIQNAAWTNQQNVFTQDQRITKVNPRLRLRDTTAGVDLKIFGIEVGATNIYIYAINDAETLGTELLRINRAGDMTVAGSAGNVACKNQANVFTATQKISNSNPLFYLNETDQPANLRQFVIFGENQYLYIQPANDAGSGVGPGLTISRASDLNVGHDLQVGGRLIVTGPTVPRVGALTSANSIQANMDTTDVVVVNALAEATTFWNPIGTKYDTMPYMIRIRDNGVAQTINWDTQFYAGTLGLPTATVPFHLLHLGFRWVAFLGIWALVAKSSD